MKSAYSRQLNQFSGWECSIRNWTSHRCFLVYPQVSSVFVVIFEILLKYSAKMVFTKDDDMICAFASNTSVQPLHIGVLLGTAVGRQYLFDSHRFDAPSKPISIDAIAIPKQKSWCGVPGECFDYLLRGPFRGRMFSYIEVNDLTSSMAQYYEHEQQTKSDCRDDQEVYSHHFGHVVLDEGSPRLRWRFRAMSA